MATGLLTLGALLALPTPAVADVETID